MQKKNKCAVLYRDGFVFAKHCGVQEERCRVAGRKCPPFKVSLNHPMN